MKMDISETLAPTSDQLDAVDLLGGPRIFTIERVSKGNAEQPVNVHLAEFPRVWRPGKSMRRVLASCWGTNGAEWAGRRVELFCDENVVFGGKTVGGTRISRISHINGPKKIPLLITRGKSAMFTVDPLPDAPPALTDAMVATADEAQLRAWWNEHPGKRDAIKARVDELKAAAADALPIDALSGEGERPGGVA